MMAVAGLSVAKFVEGKQINSEQKKLDQMFTSCDKDIAAAIGYQPATDFIVAYKANNIFFKKQTAPGTTQRNARSYCYQLMSSLQATVGLTTELMKKYASVGFSKDTSDNLQEIYDALDLQFLSDNPQNSKGLADIIKKIHNLPAEPFYIT